MPHVSLQAMQACRSLAGEGDATMSRMSQWFYLFAFKWEKPLAETDIAIPAHARVPTGGTGTTVLLFDNRLEHITDGHPFRHYVFHHDEINNLSRAIGGKQTFWPDTYGWQDVYHTLTATLQNDGSIRNRVMAGGDGPVDAATPFHIRVVLARSGYGAYRVQAAFPADIAAEHASDPAEVSAIRLRSHGTVVRYDDAEIGATGERDAFDRANAARATTA